jgi:tellurite resistance protein TehA-like permease
MDHHAHQSDSRLTNAPDLLPPLMPPKPAHSSEHHRSRVGEAVVESEAGPSSSLSSRSTNDRTAPVTRHPNLTTEAEEERRFLQGDFGKKDADAPTRPRRRRKDASSKGRSRDPTKAAKGLRERVLHMTPSWFAVTMGTGVIATLLNLLPWPSIHGGLRYPAAVWLVGDMILFIIFTAGFLARYILYPQVLPLTIKHPQKSMFLGTFPMGLMVIISGICQLGTNEFGLGLGPALAASGLWWFATFISLLTAIGVPFMVTTYQSHSFSSTTAALLLPIVPPITAAATGSVIAQALMVEYPTYAFTIVIVSYMVLGVGLPMALLILVLYFQRLLLFKQPPREVIISVFLPLGPCGQGGEALLHLGQVAYALFPTISAPSPQSTFSDAFDQTNTAELTLPVGQALFGAGLLGALMLWALGMWWFMLGIATLLRELKRGRLTFNMGWWGATFPLGSLAICTARLGLVLDSLTLKIVYTALTILTLAVWFTVAIPTAIGFFDGTLLSR